MEELRGLIGGGAPRLHRKEVAGLRGSGFLSQASAGDSENSAGDIGAVGLAQVSPLDAGYLVVHPRE